MQDVIKKLKFKNNGVVINAPKQIAEEFLQYGLTTAFDKKEKSTNTLIFINNNKEFVNYLKTSLQNIMPDSVLWFAYPKGSSKIKSDINRNTIRMSGEEYGLATVTAISIDETWSALRFRPVEMVGK